MYEGKKTQANFKKKLKRLHIRAFVLFLNHHLININFFDWWNPGFVSIVEFASML